MILRSSTENENKDLRHAGMDRRHPGPQIASGDIMQIWVPAVHAGTTSFAMFTYLKKPHGNKPPHQSNFRREFVG
jgi:hypothetical protein